jgi:hypothetical protein
VRARLPTHVSPLVPAVALALAIALTAAPIAPAPSLAASAPARAAKPKGKPDRGFPWAKRLRAAARYASGRAGIVSFAVVDERGRMRGLHRGTQYSSASLVKAMLLVAYLRGARGRGLSPSERALLGPMIRVSDNDAADAIYARVGPSGLRRLARRAGMRRFAASPAWGGSQVTAADQARFFRRIGSLLPRRHRKYGLGLLRRVISAQRWGIPRGAPRGWRVHFKGGWYPADAGGWRVHQGALLRRGRRRLGIAVLTSGDPGLRYGATTIAGVTRRLLRGYGR